MSIGRFTGAIVGSLLGAGVALSGAAIFSGHVWGWALLAVCGSAAWVVIHRLNVAIRKLDATPTASSPYLEEIHQTPGWWDSQFKKLLDANRPPYNPSEHEGHRVEVSYTLLSARGREYCVNCGRGEA